MIYKVLVGVSYHLSVGVVGSMPYFKSTFNKGDPGSRPGLRAFFIASSVEMLALIILDSLVKLVLIFNWLLYLFYLKF